MRSLAALATVAVLALGAGCAEATSDDEAATIHAVASRTHSDALHVAVGTLTHDGAPRCTGTLVAPNVVLTAAHCFTGPESLEFALDAPSEGQPRYRPMASGSVTHPYAFVHPDFDGEAHDLAFIVLSESVPAHVARPAGVGSHANAAPCAFDVVGYRHMDGADGEDLEGARRTKNICLTDEQPSADLLTAKGLDGSACVGDRGGSLILRGRGTDVLVGVVRGDESCAGAATHFTPLSAESAFVQKALATGARARTAVSID